MEHLSTDKIIAFLEIDKLDEESINLTKEVNTHLVRCEQCRKLVMALENINQAFDSLTSEKLKELDFENKSEKRFNI